MSKSNKRSAFAECNDTLYVQLKAVMPFLVACCDSIALSFFADDKQHKYPYITVEFAIEWTTKEMDTARGRYLNDLVKNRDILKKNLTDWKSHKISEGERA